MSFDSRYSLAQVTASERKGYYGIEAKKLGRSWHETAQGEEMNSCPWLNSYNGINGGSNGVVKPEFWTDGDTFLVTKIGTKVRYEKSRWNNKSLEKTIGRYSSHLVNSKINQTNADLSEKDLLGDVDYISDSCDLRDTTVKALPKLKKIGGNLTIDAASKLESIGSLKEVQGKITVIARSKDEMNEYLKKVGISDEHGNLTVNAKNGVEFVMKNYF